MYKKIVLSFITFILLFSINVFWQSNSNYASEDTIVIYSIITNILFMLSIALLIRKNYYKKKYINLYKNNELLANIKDELTNTRASFVYIISNIGSFGENIFKIVMTIRLEPMDRISELSSASVPFPFDAHSIIFS